MNKDWETKVLEENPPFEIENLNQDSILEDEIFDYLLAIPNSPSKTRIIEKLRTKAKELKVVRAFNSIFKQKNQEYIQLLKSKGGNIVKFTDCPIENLKCGQWNADDTGVYKMDYTATMQPIKIKACSHPIITLERLVNIDTNIEKVKIGFYKDKKWQYVIVEKNTIASKNKIMQLANLGIEVNENNAKDLITYLADIMELNNIELKISVGHLGWVDKEFVPYSNKYSLDVDKEFKQKINSISENGNYEKWKEYMVNLRENNLALRFMMATSFASVLVKIFKLNTFIVHLWGKSGNGKTVAEMICASIWGKPDNNFISNLSNTSIANERLCNFYKNMPILLDELQIAKAKYKSFDELIYVLTEGKGKERGTVDNGIREQTSWQTIIILNGEEPITSDTSKEGVKNRVIEINEDNLIIKDGNSTVKFIQENYGFAGKQFLELIKDREELGKIQQHFIDELNNVITYKKQINSFSIIMTADYIVSKKIFKDNPININELQRYIRVDTDEVDRYINLIIDTANANINNFYDSNNNFPPSGQIWGKLEKTTDGKGAIIYYDFIPTRLYQILEENNINWNSIKKKMTDKGYLIKSSEGKYQTAVRMPNGIQKLIRIKNIYLSVTPETPNNP